MSSKRQMPLVLTSLLILSGCTTLSQMTGLGTQTTSGEKAIKTAICNSFHLINANRGKPDGVTRQDIENEVQKDNPVPHVKNLVGDTSQTLLQIDQHNAAWHAVCD